MIEKMKFLSIMGPKSDCDRAILKYLNKYEIQLENALTELKAVENLTPFIEENPYKEILSKCDELIRMLSVSESSTSTLTLDESKSLIERLEVCIKDIKNKRHSLDEECKKYQNLADKLEPFKSLDFEVATILKFKFIKYRFGRFSKEHFLQFESHIYDDTEMIFIKCHEDKNYTWGAYFVPEEKSDAVDEVCASLHFERIYLPDEYEGNTGEAYENLILRAEALKAQTDTLDNQMLSILEENKENLQDAHNKLSTLSSNFELRKVAACTKEKQQVFYVFCGWMTEKDADAFIKEIKEDENIFCTVEEDPSKIRSAPPTKIRNPKIFRPFEMFIKMYGVPAHDEFDPTIFVALSYALIFGVMFGDVGQGLCLVVGGALLYKYKKINLAAIIACCGVSSVFFGMMFGSFFGFEDVIPALWMHPKEKMVTLPFFGNLNYVFVVAIAFGMFLLIATMIFNIINCVRSHKLEGALFDSNGVAGLVFYASFVLVIVLFLSGHRLPSVFILIVMFVIPLAFIACKEPLMNLIEKKSELIPGGKGMYVVQTFFELFEILLSYFSNTLSFVRIGAYAVSHAAMMEVVLMLSGYESGNSNWIVIILGNIFVMALEGLIVGIQVLRLQYYEMFSRFYSGSGREFKPYSPNNHSS